MQKSFSFKGIARNTDNLIAQEGECLDIVNMRMKNGSLQPMPQPVELASLPYAYSAACWHELAGCYICITADEGRLHFYNSEWQPLADDRVNAPLRSGELSRVRRVEPVGNVVCCFTECSICYIIYDTGCYRLLGERPPVPQLGIVLKSRLQSVTTDTKFAVNVNASNVDASWSRNEKGYIDKCISLLNADGYYIDRALFRFAIRMYDGSYIYTSHIIYASDQCYDDGVGRDTRNMTSEMYDSSDGYAHYKVRVRGFKPEFTFTGLELDGWKGIVAGIDLFTTGSILGRKVDKVLSIYGGPEDGTSAQVMSEMYMDKTIDELHDDIASASLYYRIAEFDIEGNVVSTVDDVSDVNLALQQGLQSQDVAGSMATFSAGCSYVLNNRLHIAALKEHFFRGYDAGSLMPVGEGSAAAEAIVVHTKLETATGTYVVENNLGDILVGHGHNTLELPPLLSYPDARATEMMVYLYNDTELFVKSFPLIPHKYLNVSQYLHKWYSPYTVTVESFFTSGATAEYVSDNDVLGMFEGKVGVHEVVFSKEKGCWMYDGREFPGERYASLRVFAISRGIADGDRLVFTIEDSIDSFEPKDIYNIPFDSTWQLIGGGVPDVTGHACEERGNVLKVSLVDNPFTFPAETTYAPSQEHIVAMSSNTFALSQGQFGEHPLYVFCNDGIWAMSVERSGAIAYAGCFPLSRERCVNAASVCGTDAGVLFAGEKGLMILRGSSLKRISEPMDDVVCCDEILQGDIFKRIYGIASLRNCSETMGFAAFLANARIAYLAPNNEIVAACAGCGYSYILSLDYSAWSRVSWNASAFVKGTLSMMALNVADSSTSVMELGNALSGDNRVLLFTRPQMWGTKMRKRVVQLMLHCSAHIPAKCTPDVPLVACYMLCSNDGVNFKLVAGAEKKIECRDVAFPYYPSQSYSHFLFAIAGELGEGSLLTGVELELDVAWKNRLG